MHAPGGGESEAGDAAGAGQKWLGNSVWRSPEVELLSIKAWVSIAAASYHRGAGESVWRGDRHRIVLTLDQLPPSLVQIEQGHTQEFPLAPPGALAFSPVRPHDPERSPRREGGFADKILIESLGTALCIRIAQRFIGRLPLPISKGLSRERLQRVRDYVEAHLDGNLSLTVLADAACLSPYHFSRSFKEAAGVGPQRYVMQRRLARARTLMRRTHQPLAWIAQEAGFVDQSHLTSIFRREMGVTPGRFRASLA